MMEKKTIKTGFVTLVNLYFILTFHQHHRVTSGPISLKLQPRKVKEEREAGEIKKEKKKLLKEEHKEQKKSMLKLGF